MDALPIAVLARKLGRSAALLIVLALFTGFLVAGAMTKQFDAEPHALLAAHLNAFLGAFWMLGVAWSLPLLRLSAKSQQALCWLTIVSNYANWFLTGLKGILKVVGVTATSDPKNNLIYAALSVFVVLPSLAAGLLWLWGFRTTAENP